MNHDPDDREGQSSLITHRICFHFPQKASLGITDRQDRILPAQTELHVEKYLESDHSVVVDVKLIIESVEIITESVDRIKLPGNRSVVKY